MVFDEWKIVSLFFEDMQFFDDFERGFYIRVLFLEDFGNDFVEEQDNEFVDFVFDVFSKYYQRYLLLQQVERIKKI